MSAIINRAALREELQRQNRALQSVKASIRPLRTAIGSYVSDSDLQGSGFSAHKNYLTEGHIPTLDTPKRFDGSL